MTQQLSLDVKSGQWLADWSIWERTSAPGNDEQIERLRRNLQLARKQTLTPRQQEVLALYYDYGLTVGQIAQQLELNRSTISRTLQRARSRLYRCLRYTL